jgi:teichuronic acid biosynthesis glycosyltransferase TuaC
MFKNAKEYIWVHSFNNNILNSGIFMYVFYDFLHRKNSVNLRMYQLGIKSNLLSFVFGAIKLIFKSNSSDVIHLQYGSYSGFICSFLPRKKILTLRGSDIITIHSANFFTKLHSTIGVLLTKYSLFKYDKIIVMSNRMMESIPSKYRNKTIVLPDPIDLNKFYVKNKIECRRKIFPNIDPEKILVLFTAIDLANPIKRYNLAIETINEVNKISNNRYVLVSAFDIDNANMVDVYNAVDICLLTSSHEGWPNCIKEALACNVPFVSTDVSDLSLIANKTQNCFTSQDNAIELAANILKIKLDYNENLREKIKFLSLDNISNKLEELYMSI